MCVSAAWNKYTSAHARRRRINYTRRKMCDKVRECLSKFRPRRWDMIYSLFTGASRFWLQKEGKRSPKITESRAMKSRGWARRRRRSSTTAIISSHHLSSGASVMLHTFACSLLSVSHRRTLACCGITRLQRRMSDLAVKNHDLSALKLNSLLARGTWNKDLILQLWLCLQRDIIRF